MVYVVLNCTRTHILPFFAGPPSVLPPSKSLAFVYCCLFWSPTHPSPSLSSFLLPPFFFWVSYAHASGDLELSLLVLPSERRCCDHTWLIYYFKDFHCQAVLVVGILLNILVNLSFFPFFLTAFLIICYYYWNSNQLCRFFCFSQICLWEMCHHHFFLPLVSEQKQLSPPFPNAFVSSLSYSSPLSSAPFVYVFSLLKGHLFHFISSSHLVCALAPAGLMDTLSGSPASFWKPLYIRRALDSTLELEPWANCLVWCVNHFL